MPHEVYSFPSASASTSRNSSPVTRLHPLEPLPLPSSLPCPTPSTASLPPNELTIPSSPSFFVNHLADVVGGLYYCDGGNKVDWDLWTGVEAGWRRKRRRRIGQVVKRCYERYAVFENPLTSAIGSDLITRHFGLLALVPGRLWSDVIDVCETQYYDNTHLMILTHVLNISLFPSPTPTSTTSMERDSEPTSQTNIRRLLTRSASTLSFNSVTGPMYRYRAAGSIYHPSSPGTPFPMTPIGYGTPEHYFSRSRAASLRDQTASFFPLQELDRSSFDDCEEESAVPPSSQQSQSSLKSILTFYLLVVPFVCFLTLIRWIFGPVTIHLKLHTRLYFNESGKIYHHEDVWGVREFIEAFILPNHVGRLIYGVWRRLVGESVGIAISTLSGETLKTSSYAVASSSNLQRRDGSVTPRQPLHPKGFSQPMTTAGLLQTIRQALEDFAVGVEGQSQREGVDVGMSEEQMISGVVSRSGEDGGCKYGDEAQALGLRLRASSSLTSDPVTGAGVEMGGAATTTTEIPSSIASPTANSDVEQDPPLFDKLSSASAFMKRQQRVACLSI